MARDWLTLFIGALEIRMNDVDMESQGERRLSDIQSEQQMLRYHILGDLVETCRLLRDKLKRR